MSKSLDAVEDATSRSRRRRRGKPRSFGLRPGRVRLKGLWTNQSGLQVEAPPAAFRINPARDRSRCSGGWRVVAMVNQDRRTVKASRARETSPASDEGSHARRAASHEQAPAHGRSRAVGPAPAERERVVARNREAVVPGSDSIGDIRLGFLSDCVGFHFRLAQDASYRTFATHHDRDLIKPGRYLGLAIIHLNPGISQSALGRAIARDKSTVSPLIKDLQKKGFINRTASTQDSRSVTLSLTGKGERTLDRLRARDRTRRGTRSPGRRVQGPADVPARQDYHQHVALSDGRLPSRPRNG